jgi:hypothetical protein
VAVGLPARRHLAGHQRLIWGVHGPISGALDAEMAMNYPPTVIFSSSKTILEVFP